MWQIVALLVQLHQVRGLVILGWTITREVEAVGLCWSDVGFFFPPNFLWMLGLREMEIWNTQT